MNFVIAREVKREKLMNEYEVGELSAKSEIQYFALEVESSEVILFHLDSTTSRRHKIKERERESEKEREQEIKSEIEIERKRERESFKPCVRTTNLFGAKNAHLAFVNRRVAASSPLSFV